MRKENITAYVNSYAHEGEIIVPSAVLTSTPQEEELNLSYTPNFQLKLEDSYNLIKDVVEVEFSTYEGGQYNAYMNTINRSGNIVTLQYVYGLSYTDAPQPEPEPEPEPEHTLTISKNSFTCSNYINGASGEAEDSELFNVYYDNVAITNLEEIAETAISGMTHCSMYAVYAEEDPVTGDPIIESFAGYRFVANGDDAEPDTYTDNITITYEGLSVQCTVAVTLVGPEDGGGDDDSSDDLEPEIYYVNAGNITNATVTYNEEGLTAGETTTFAVTPNSGYVLDSLVVEEDITGETVNTTDLGNNEYSFTMPANDVYINVECISDGEK